LPIISASWITESITPHSLVDTASGLSYGYMWNVFPEGSMLADMFGGAGFYHTGVGVHALVVIPELDLVIVQRYNTDGSWEDPGDIGMEMGLMVVNARLSD
jgi:CubicO group peptidase (beta-lactamase class C family)